LNSRIFTGVLEDTVPQERKPLVAFGTKEHRFPFRRKGSEPRAFHREKSIRSESMEILLASRQPVLACSSLLPTGVDSQIASSQPLPAEKKTSIRGGKATNGTRRRREAFLAATSLYHRWSLQPLLELSCAEDGESTRKETHREGSG
jgi:hypothetical protein